MALFAIGLHAVNASYSRLAAAPLPLQWLPRPTLKPLTLVLRTRACRRFAKLTAALLFLQVPLSPIRLLLRLQTLLRPSRRQLHF